MNGLVTDIWRHSIVNSKSYFHKWYSKTYHSPRN